MEAIADQTRFDLARDQGKKSKRKICGQGLRVPSVEAAGKKPASVNSGGKTSTRACCPSLVTRIFNEMGITSKLFPTGRSLYCATPSASQTMFRARMVSEHIDQFTRFIRATEAPARALSQQARTPSAERGAELFVKIGCADCHVPTLTTAPAGTVINGGTFTIPAALGGKTFHPYGDFPCCMT